MIQQAALDELWGAIIDDWSITVSDFTLTMTATVHAGVSRVSYELQFIAVKAFRFENRGSMQWDVIELTSAELTQSEKEAAEIRMEFWNGSATALVRCRQLRVWKV